MSKINSIPSTIFEDGKPLEKKDAWLLALVAKNKEHLEEFILFRKNKLNELEKKKILIRQNNFFSKYLIHFILLGLGIIGIFTITPIGIPFALGMGGYLAYLFNEFSKNVKLELGNIEKELSDLQSRKPTLITTHFGEANAMVQSVPFEDKTILIDKSGFIENKEYSYPDIPHKDRFNKLKQSLDNLKIEATPLLDNSRKSDLGQNFQFLGVESEINEILDTENKLLDQKVDIKICMPAYQGNDNMARSLSFLKDSFNDFSDEDMVIFQNEDIDESSVKGLEEIIKNAKEAKKLGESSIEEFLESSIQECENKIVEIEKSRDNSILKVLKSPLDNLKSIFDYPLTKFYCPSCLEAPDYLISKLPVRPEEISEASLENLKSYENSEELISMRKQLDTLKKYAQMLIQDNKENSESFLSIKSKISNFEKVSIMLARKLYRSDTKKELERKNAVLKFNIKKNKWCCSLCSSEYKENEISDSRILKIKEDLIHPIWDNLWLEKHDESLRILREKESELRTNMNEESKQLRAESDVFTQEYRAARSQLDDSSAGYEGNITELKEMSRFFAARGILPEEEVESFNNELFGDGNSLTLSEILEEADNMERQLELEPESVFLRYEDIQEYPEQLRAMKKYYRAKCDYVKIIPKSITKSIVSKNNSEEDNTQEVTI